MKLVLKEAYDYAYKYINEGERASYIPELLNVERDRLAISITDTRANKFSVGNIEDKFTMQSISKTILLAIALEECGFDNVFSIVGMEPTGDKFNSIARLETDLPIPLNPMINAGAIAVCSLIKGNSLEDRLEKLINKTAKLIGKDSVKIDEKVFNSELITGDRNRALAYMLRASGVIKGSVKDTLDLYFKACSLLVNVEELSFFASVLANNGICILTRKRLIGEYNSKIIRSLMSTCGLYDASGEFALRVGLPAKSGVGGGIIAVSPGRYGIATFSPALDENGNSISSMKALEYISKNLSLSIY